MNRKLLQKVIDELLKDKPDLSYIRGIVETMLESLPDENKIDPIIKSLCDGIKPIFPLSEVTSSHDEGSMLDTQAKAMMDKMKPIQYE